MKQSLPKKWSRRILAIRIGATLLGGAVLVVLLALLGMLYWMNAKAPVVDPAKMIYPDAPAWIMLFRFVPSANARVLPAELLSAATRGMPEQAAKLVEKGFNDPSCPVAVVLSHTHVGERVMAVNLGKYPGMFRLVRRDLERRAEKRLLPYAIKYHSGAPMFFTEGAEPSGLMPMTIRGTTIIQAPNTTGMERLLDWINDPTPMTMDYPDGTSCILDARSWPLLTQLAGDFAPQWGKAVEVMGKELPVLGRLEGIYFSGGADGVGLQLAAATPEDAAEVAKALPEWIRKNPKIGSTTLAVGKVETIEKSVTIHLTATPAPAPVTPVP